MTFPSNTPNSSNHPDGFPPVLPQDRFELLSAYLDSEVTAAERSQVEVWLRQDPQFQQVYHRLLKLRQGIHSSAVPNGSSVDQVAHQVMTRLDRRPKLSLVWGGGMAIAALVIGTLTTVFSDQRLLVPNMVQAPSGDVPAEELLLSLDQPVIDLHSDPHSTQLPFDIDRE